MLRSRCVKNSAKVRHGRKNSVSPLVEDLETRILLYSDLGDQWTYSSRITYSFMPDGTSVGGVPSALFQTLNSVAPTATWQAQIEQAASLWEGATNANLALVSDGGEAVGCDGAQQDDPRFGDIRIGAVPLGSGVLAETFLPPPSNGGTDAGDILLNSSINWKIGSNYDLLTVTAHEFGHALGLGESTVSTAVMYGTYTGIKTALTTDDISGIDSIYGTRPYDQFNSNGTRNNIYQNATNITSYLSSAEQIAIPSLDNTTTSDSEWYYVTVPSSTTGTMAVTVQSSNLSSFSPKLQIYNSSMGLVGQSSAINSFGATVTLSESVQAGQSYYFKVLAAGAAGAVGGYGLLANFGSGSQSPIQPPNTYVASQPSQGNGTINNLAPLVVGSLSAWTIGYTETGTGGNAAQSIVANGSTPHPSTALSPAHSSTSSTQPAAVTSNQTATASIGDLMSPESLSANLAVGPNIAVLQAVDEALASWSSPSRQGRVIG